MATSRKKPSASSPKKKARTSPKSPAAKPKAAKTPVAATPVQAEKPGSTVTAQVALEAPGRKSKSRKWLWTQLIIAGIIILVGAETFFILKDKIAHQGKLELIRVIGERGGPPDKTGKFWGPGRIRVSDALQRVCIVDSTFYKVIYWDTQNGSMAGAVDKQGTHRIAPQGQVVQNQFAPLNGDFDGEGNLYVLDRQHAQVVVFGLDMQPKTSWPVVSAESIAADKAGNVYVVDGGTMEIIQYSAAGREVNRFGKEALISPVRMATDAKGNLYVVDRGRKKIVVLSPKGKELRAFSVRFKPFGNPDIDVKAGKVYLCEHDNQRVFVYSTKGKLLWDLTASYPGVIGADDQGLVYISGAGGIHQFRIIKRY